MQAFLLAPLLLTSVATAEKKNVLWIGNSFSFWIPARTNIIAKEGGHEINIGEKTTVSACKEKVNKDVDEEIEKDATNMTLTKT